MKIQTAKTIIKENYENYIAYDNIKYLDNPKVMDALYCLGEFSQRMIKRSFPHTETIKEDLVQEMVLRAYKTLKNQDFSFGCIQNFMQTSGTNYIRRYDLLNLDSGKVYTPYSTVEAQEAIDNLIYDQTDDFELFFSFVSVINKISKSARQKLNENMATYNNNLFLLPVLLCVFRQDDRLIKTYPNRTKLVLRKIVYELNEELKNVRI